MRIDIAQCGRTVGENAKLTARAESAGWQGSWVSEIAGIDAVTTASAAALSLKQGRVGSAIFAMQTRDPMLLAMTATSLGQIAPGGFVLGLGTSTKIIIEDWHATPWGTSPLGLTRECVDLTRQFLAGERVTTDTGRWRYRRAQLSVRPESPIPIYLAALNDRMLELAGEIADGVILNFVTVQDLAHAKTCVARGAARVGRKLDGFEYIVYFRATVTDDYERVKQRYQRELFTYVMAPVYQEMFAREGYRDACLESQTLWRAGERDQALDAIPPALIQDRTLVGTAEEIDARINAYAAAGLDSAMIFPVAIPDEDYFDDTVRTIDHIGRTSSEGAATS